MLGAFLALMMLFTMLSRAADSIGIPTVETSTIQNMVIAHKVTAQGKVVQNREQAVSTEPNQVVKAIYVNEGQQVEEGELLFELDMEELKEQILAVKQELQKQELQSADNKSSQETDAASKALTRKHTASNYCLLYTSSALPAAGAGSPTATPPPPGSTLTSLPSARRCTCGCSTAARPF